MRHLFVGSLTATFVVGIISAGVIWARPSPDTDMRPGAMHSGLVAAPSYCIAAHRVGRISMAITNYGIFGAGATGSSSSYIKGTNVDCFTGGQMPACEYPKGSGTEYLYSGNFWIGAVVGRDTLVSVGADGWQQDMEFNPDDPPFGDMLYRSIMDPSKPEFDDAVSEEDFICKYTDTITSGVAGLRLDRIDNRPHRPLRIEVSERSFAWSYDYAEDFVLFDYSITNVGFQPLNRVFMGVYVDADVGGLDNDDRPNDDVCGFRLDIPTPRDFSSTCDWKDTINFAWIADNDGDLTRDLKVPAITGTRIVRTPADSLEVSFNWWVGNTTPSRDFGPQTYAKARELSTGGEGTPEGDRNKYAFMSNKEFDYDQVFTASITPDDSIWRFPNQLLAREVSKGYDTRYLLSFGPFRLEAGQTVPISLAYVAGDNFHIDPNNGKDNLVNGYDPGLWYSKIDFTDIGLNAMWAGWLYDNPGYDSDNDGYLGKSRICTTFVSSAPLPLRTDTISYAGDNDLGTSRSSATTVSSGSLAYRADTIFYEGDGVPDFRGASPPPAPKFWLEPSDYQMRVRFNGIRTENDVDVFSRVKDFEGYRVYLGLDERASSMSVIESYDLEDYVKYVYDPSHVTGTGWNIYDDPFTLKQLRDIYGGGIASWDPLAYSISDPYVQRSAGAESDSLLYFAKQDHNNSRPGISTNISKIYPNESLPPVAYLGYTADSALSNLPKDTLAKYFTPDGWLLYYEYELTINNLLPTVPYYVNVTAFDFGSPSSKLQALETSRTVGIKSAFPQGNGNGKIANDPNGDGWVGNVYVYPNPYRIDGKYLVSGFEGRQKDLRNNAPDRQRIVNFANLPPICTIRIYSLDGDLIREITHRIDSSNPLSTHDSWDLITRNTQLVVSGLYYWAVEDDRGNVQIGKLVLIM